MISSYSFGKIVVNGKRYTSDIIIYPNGHIQDSWWRQSGHLLIQEDIKDLLLSQPDLLVVGTGASGFMRISKELEAQLEDLLIDIIALASAEAAEEFNKHCRQKKVGACFHLTC